ncbi:MAG: GHMP kinase, partial [Chloroflexi bacterium]|nr:GHMP kinase [Chloroflexota bacterium]
RTDVLIGLRDLAQEGREHLEAGRLDALGACMHRGWEFKRRLASAISSQAIDEMYEAARRAGALGGKITGAGGGGFMLLYCPPKSQDAVRYALRGLRELPFRLERDGSKVILNVRRD